MIPAMWTSFRMTTSGVCGIQLLSDPQLADRVVEAVPQHRLQPGLADRSPERLHRLRNWRIRARHVVNAFLPDRPVQVVRAEHQRALGEFQPVTDPVSLYMREIIEIRPAYRDGLQRLLRACLR